MRITFLAPHDSLNGGVRVVALYARLLQDRGHDVSIVSSPRARPSLRAQLGAELPFSLLVEHCIGRLPRQTPSPRSG